MEITLRLIFLIFFLSSISQQGMPPQQQMRPMMAGVPPMSPMPGMMPMAGQPQQPILTQHQMPPMQPTANSNIQLDPFGA